MWIMVGVLLVLCVINYGISFLEWASRKNVSPMDTQVWQQVRINTSECLQKKLVRIRGIPHGDVHLSTLSAQAPRPPDEEPDDPI